MILILNDTWAVTSAPLSMSANISDDMSSLCFVTYILNKLTSFKCFSRLFFFVLSVYNSFFMMKAWQLNLVSMSQFDLCWAEAHRGIRTVRGRCSPWNDSRCKLGGSWMDSPSGRRQVPPLSSQPENVPYVGCGAGVGLENDLHESLKKFVTGKCVILSFCFCSFLNFQT